MALTFGSLPVMNYFILEQSLRIRIQAVIPIFQPGQTFPKLHGSCEAEQLASSRRVGVKTQYVTRSRLIMNHLAIASADDMTDLSGQLIDRDFIPLA